jgi:hypothetical protein
MSRVLAAVVLAVAVAAPARNLSAQRTLTIIARDTGLVAPPTVPAGVTTIRLVLNGKARRDLVVHRIPAGMTPEELVRGAVGRPSRWFEQWSFGGPAVPRDSSNEASVTMDLRPGRYALVSYEVDATGRPRGDKHMWVLVNAMRSTALIPDRLPVADATLKVRDNRIDMIGALRRGQRSLRIENIGTQPHELVIVRLKAGKTANDAQRWFRDRKDAPPFVYVGGVTPMSPGASAQTRLVLQAGPHVVLTGNTGSVVTFNVT